MAYLDSLNDSNTNGPAMVAIMGQTLKFFTDELNLARERIKILEEKIANDSIKHKAALKDLSVVYEEKIKVLEMKLSEKDQSDELNRFDIQKAIDNSCPFSRTYLTRMISSGITEYDLNALNKNSEDKKESKQKRSEVALDILKKLKVDNPSPRKMKFVKRKISTIMANRNYDNKESIKKKKKEANAKKKFIPEEAIHFSTVLSSTKVIESTESAELSIPIYSEASDIDISPRKMSLYDPTKTTDTDDLKINDDVAVAYIDGEKIYFAKVLDNPYELKNNVKKVLLQFYDKKDGLYTIDETSEKKREELDFIIKTNVEIINGGG